MTPPRLERCLALLQIGVTVVDGGNTPDRTGNMVEDAVDDMRWDIQLRHPCCSRPAEVVKRPSRNAPCYLVTTGSAFGYPFGPQLCHSTVETLLSL